MTNEKDINPIVAAMCRGLAQYDANEVLPDRDTTTTSDNKGYSD